MNGLTNGIGINVEVERNWTWIYGNTYPIKEELKQQWQALISEKRIEELYNETTENELKERFGMLNPM